MTQFLRFRFASLLLLLAVLLYACKPADDILPRGNYVQGALVVNEGTFLNSNASISFISFTSSGVQQDVFGAVNARPLGDVAQSMTLHNDLGYVVVNNSNKIEVVDPYSMRSVATFDSLQLPRYAVGHSSLIFVSEWVNFTTPRGNVVVMNAANGNIVRRISVGRYPERMVQQGGFIYVASADFGNTGYVYIISASSATLVDSIATNNNPTSLVFLGSDLWVSCAGNYDSGTFTHTTAGNLQRINPTTKAVLAQRTFAVGDKPSQLVLARPDSLAFFLMGTQVWRLTKSGSAPTAVISANSSNGFYGLGYEPFRGILYCGKAIGFSGPGRVLRYRESDYMLQDSVSVGIAPNSFAFVYN